MSSFKSTFSYLSGQGRALGVRSAPCVQDFDSERPQPACLQEEMPSPERGTWWKKWEWGWMKGVFSGVPFFSEKKTRLMFWRWENCHKCCSVKVSFTCVPWKVREHLSVSGRNMKDKHPIGETENKVTSMFLRNFGFSTKAFCDQLQGQHYHYKSISFACKLIV